MKALAARQVLRQSWSLEFSELLSEPEFARYAFKLGRERIASANFGGKRQSSCNQTVAWGP